MRRVPFILVLLLIASHPLLAEDPGHGQELLAELNRERLRAGLVPLVSNGRLDLAAQAHADDMARTGTLSHTGGDGSRLRDRLKRAGYEFRLAAENVAAGTPNGSATVQLWLMSEGHRRNMLEPEVREVGIGHARPPLSRPTGYTDYWTLVLAAPL